MAAQVLGISGSVVSIGVTGLLGEAELNAVQAAAAEAIRERGRVRMLVMAEDFEGWAKGEWHESELEARNDLHIDKMAIVGERRWQDLALAFTAQGLRPFPIEYFGPDELERAMAWLQEP